MISTKFLRLLAWKKEYGNSMCITDGANKYIKKRITTAIGMLIRYLQEFIFIIWKMLSGMIKVTTGMCMC